MISRCQREGTGATPVTRSMTSRKTNNGWVPPRGVDCESPTCSYDHENCEGCNRCEQICNCERVQCYDMSCNCHECEVCGKCEDNLCNCNRDCDDSDCSCTDRCEACGSCMQTCTCEPKPKPKPKRKKKTATPVEVSKPEQPKQEEPKQPTMATAIKKKQIVDALTHGAGVAAADEAANLILEIGNDIVGDAQMKHLTSTPQGASMTKAVLATLLIHGVDVVTEDASQRQQVEKACELVLEAASRDLLQPKMSKIRARVAQLAQAGSKCLTSASPA